MSQPISKTTLSRVRIPFKYASFWSRLLAFTIDSLFLVMIFAPLILWWHGWQELSHTPIHFSFSEELILNGLPMIATLVFWHYRSATPGKMMLGLRIIDVHTGNAPSWNQLIIRMFSYMVSMIPAFLGFVWILFDPNQQAWHDKLSSTAVVYQ